MIDPVRWAALADRLARLERSERRWRRAAVLGVTLAGLLAAAGLVLPRGAAARQGAGAAADHLALARSRLALSRQALDLIRRSGERGAQVINQREDFYRWSYRLLGDQIYLSMAAADPRVADPEVYLAVSHARPNADRLAAFEAHARRMRDWEDLMLPLYRRQVLSPIDFLDVQSYRLEAELWLERERVKERAERAARPAPAREEPRPKAPKP